jgi:chaperonin GroES
MMPMPGMEQPQVPQPQQPQEFPPDQTNIIDIALAKANVAKKLDEDERQKIADDVCRLYRQDDDSRKNWIKQNNDWMKLALQVVEEKTFPWPGASNVKYPLLTTAALQFSARAYPALVSSNNLVQVKIFGKDVDGTMTQRVNTLGKHMSYQILHEMYGWEEGMDRLCYILPIIGTCFKKVYYDPVLEVNCSELVLPKDLVVNYWAKDLCRARKTHKLYYTANECVERINNEYYLDVDEVRKPGTMAGNATESTPTGKSPAGVQSDDSFVPRIILEQHTLLDLDDDGYAEPYIVTVDLESGKLLRIGARFRQDGVKKEGNKIVSIKPLEFFVKYDFLPNPDGGFYGAGFGLLLGGINEALNTLINQLIDSGTLANLQTGFISKGLRIQKGEQPVRPGEWIPVNSFADDLRKGILPLPAKEPSTVLFSLLGTLAQTGKEISSVSEVFTGGFPGQNTPASTTSAVIEEGMKVFTSIHKRIHRCAGEEFTLLYKLNQIYAPERTDFTLPVAGTEDGVEHNVVRRDDYSATPVQGEQTPGSPFVKVLIGSDPNMINDAQKVLKVQQLLELNANLHTLNPMEITKIALETQGQDGIEKLMTPPPPSTPPEIQIKQDELKELARHNQMQEKIDIQNLISESKKRESEIVLNFAKASQVADQAGMAQAEAEMQRVQAQEELYRNQLEQVFGMQEHQQTLQQNEDLHQQSMDHNQQMADAKVQQIKAQAAAKPQTNESASQ